MTASGAAPDRAGLSTGTNLAIEVRGLRKSFGATKALDGVNLKVSAGRVHALLGPNGAGKTLVRILATLLRPDAGTASIAGLDVGRMLRRTGGRPERRWRNRRAHRRRTMSRCHRKIVPGVTISRAAARRPAASVPASSAGQARSAHVKRGIPW